MLSSKIQVILLCLIFFAEAVTARLEPSITAAASYAGWAIGAVLALVLAFCVAVLLLIKFRGGRSRANELRVEYHPVLRTNDIVNDVTTRQVTTTDDGSDALHDNRSSVRRSDQPLSAEYIKIPDAETHPRESANDAILCVICMEHPQDTILLPCGHDECCSDCAIKVRDMNPCCPICRRTIEDIVQTCSRNDSTNVLS